MNSFAKFGRMLSLFAILWMSVGCKSMVPKWKLPKPDFLSKSVTAKSPASTDSSEPAPKIDSKQTQIDLLMAVAENHESHGNFAAAAKSYEEAMKKDKSLAAMHRLALVKFKLGDHERAWELLNKAMKQAPNDAELLADVGYLKYLTGDYVEAEHITRRGLSIDSSCARLHNNLGLIYVELDRPEHAVEEFQLAGCSPSQAHSNVGHAYLTSQRTEKAEQYLQIATMCEQPCPKAAASLRQVASKRNAIPTKHASYVKTH
jgi:Tfp pilus assembly protein PilF